MYSFGIRPAKYFFQHTPIERASLPIFWLEIYPLDPEPIT